MAIRTTTVRFLGVLLLACCAWGCATPREPTMAPRQPEAVVRILAPESLVPLANHLATAYRRDHPTTQIHIVTVANSGGAIKGVRHHRYHLALSDRPPTPVEVDDSVESRPLAKDAIVFAVPAVSALWDLSRDDLQHIYRGTMRDWAEVGGPSANIVPLTRDPDDTARNEVLLPLMDEHPLEMRLPVLASDADLVKTLANTPNSIGFTRLGFLAATGLGRIRAVTINGAAPSARAIHQGTYPYHLTISLIHRRGLAGPDAQVLAWLTSDQARSIMEASGYVPVSSF